MVSVPETLEGKKVGRNRTNKKANVPTNDDTTMENPPREPPNVIISAQENWNAIAQEPSLVSQSMLGIDLSTELKENIA